MLADVRRPRPDSRQVVIDVLAEERVEVDVSELELGSSIHVSEIVLPPDTEMKTDGGLTVASVIVPKEIEEPEVAVEEELEGEAGVEGEDGEAPADAEQTAETESKDKKATE